MERKANGRVGEGREREEMGRKRRGREGREVNGSICTHWDFRKSAPMDRSSI